jgi:hypothetical protein
MNVCCCSSGIANKTLRSSSGEPPVAAPTIGTGSRIDSVAVSDCPDYNQETKKVLEYKLSTLNNNVLEYLAKILQKIYSSTVF